MSPVVIVRRPAPMTMSFAELPNELELAKTTSPLLMVIGPVNVLAIFDMLIVWALAAGTPVAVASNVRPLVAVLLMTPENT